MNQRVEENIVIISGDKVTYDMLKQTDELDRKFYKKEYLWDYEYQKVVFDHNKEGLIVALDRNIVIGYCHFLVISKMVYNHAKELSTIKDKYKLSELVNFSKDEKNYISINSVVIDKEYQNGIVIKKLTLAIKNILKSKELNGFFIGGINATAVTKDGQKFLERWGFVVYKKLNDGTYLYICEDDNLKEFLK